MHTYASLKSRTVPQLRDLLRELELPVSGNEKTLIQRILDHQNAQSSNPAGSDSAAEGESSASGAEQNAAEPKGEGEEETSAGGGQEEKAGESAPSGKEGGESEEEGKEGKGELSTDPTAASNSTTPQPPTSHGPHVSTVAVHAAPVLYRPVNGQTLSLAGGVPGRGVIYRGGSARMDMYVGVYLERIVLTPAQAAEFEAGSE